MRVNELGYHQFLISDEKCFGGNKTDLRVLELLKAGHLRRLFLEGDS